MSDSLINIASLLLLREASLLGCFWPLYASLSNHPRARVVLCRIISLAVLALALLSLAPIPALWHVPASPTNITVATISPVSIPATSPSLPSPSAHAPVLAESPVTTLPLPSLTQFLMTTWLLGAALLMASWILALVLAQRLLRSALPPPDAARQLLTQLAVRLGLRKSVRLGVIDEACSPLLLGPRAAILLPRQLLAENESHDLASSLAHELVHVKENDWWWSQWLHLLAAFLWPVLPVWFLRRAHDNAAEIVCDSVAADLVGGKQLYAATLARQSLHALAHPHLATVPMARRAGIRQRLDLLLSDFTLPAFSRRASLLTGLVALILCGGLGGLRLDAANSFDGESFIAKSNPPPAIGPADEAILNLQQDGTACSGSLQVPAGLSVFMVIPENFTNRFFLSQTIPLKSPVSAVPYSFYYEFSKDMKFGKASLTMNSAYERSFPFRLRLEGASGSTSSGWYVPTSSRDNVKLDLIAKPGQTILQRNQIYDLATWTTGRWKTKLQFTLKLLIADSPAGFQQFKSDRPVEPMTVKWQAESFQKPLDHPLPVPTFLSMSKANPSIRLSIAGVENNLTLSPGEGQYYEFNSIPGEVVQINLLVNDKFEPGPHLAIKLVDGKGTLATHITQDQQDTIRFTAQLETGHRRYNVSYSHTYPGPVSYMLHQPSFGTAYLSLSSKVQDLDLMAAYETPKSEFRSDFSTLDNPRGRIYFVTTKDHGKTFEKYSNPDYPGIRLQVGVQE